MCREVKFTPFGVPYILEFENVSFLPEQHTHASPSSSTSSFCYIDTPPPPSRAPLFSLPSPSSLFKRKHSSRRTADPEPPLSRADAESTKPRPQPDASEALGICIRFPSGCSQPQMTRKQRLVHLQQTISAAVLDAGMSRSPGNKTRPEEHSNRRGYKTPNALFCGTYGQMMAALEGAGLSATPCMGENLLGYARLGALFVARNDGATGVQLRKITLWG